MFPEFEFTWLGEEMRENLPKEMDFSHEARNTLRTVDEFKGIRTSLYIRMCHFFVSNHVMLTHVQRE